MHNNNFKFTTYTKLFKQNNNKIDRPKAHSFMHPQNKFSPQQTPLLSLPIILNFTAHIYFMKLTIKYKWALFSCPRFAVGLHIIRLFAETLRTGHDLFCFLGNKKG